MLIQDEEYLSVFLIGSFIYCSLNIKVLPIPNNNFIWIIAMKFSSIIVKKKFFYKPHVHISGQWGLFDGIHLFKQHATGCTELHGISYKKQFMT